MNTSHTTLSVRVPVDLAAALDREAAKLSERLGLPVDRSGVARLALAQHLSQQSATSEADHLTVMSAPAAHGFTC